MIGWIGGSIDRLIKWLIKWLIDWLTDWFFNLLIYLFVDILIYWLIYLLIDWSTIDRCDCFCFSTGSYSILIILAEIGSHHLRRRQPLPGMYPPPLLLPSAPMVRSPPPPFLPLPSPHPSLHPLDPLWFVTPTTSHHYLNYFKYSNFCSL